MPLAKLKIINLDKDGESFQVRFNPTGYSIEGGNTWKEQERPRKKPELQFTGQSLKKLSMELFFDTYEQKEDVRQYTSKVARLLVPSIEDEKTKGKRPPRCRIDWGKEYSGNSDFPFVGVLETLTQQFVLFDSNGTPVRAKLSVSFKEFLLPEEQEKREPTAQSFPAETYVVLQGDTLSGIAGQLWQKPQEWRRIAEANEIENPRQLSPGDELIIPPIED
jgi:nucleoid-associated protein YgaU